MMFYNLFTLTESGFVWHEEQGIEDADSEKMVGSCAFIVSAVRPNTVCLKTVTKRPWSLSESPSQEFLEELNELCAEKAICFYRTRGRNMGSVGIRWRHLTVEEKIQALLEK